MNALTHASYRPRIPRYYICIHRNAVNDMNIDPDYPATNPPPTKPSPPFPPHPRLLLDDRVIQHIRRWLGGGGGAVAARRVV